MPIRTHVAASTVLLACLSMSLPACSCASSVHEAADAQVADATNDAWPYLLCCAPGEGRACCPAGSLADPDAGRIAWCFQYGGLAGECVPEGGSVDRHDLCATCCDGLTMIESIAPATGSEPPDQTFERNGHTCVLTSVVSVFECTHCGDHACRGAENPCNCPSDCP